MKYDKYQEAKEILKLYDYSTKLELSEGHRNDITDNISVAQFMQMKEICLELLDKATPKKPKTNSTFKMPIGNYVTTYHCPTCNVKFQSKTHHCPCGQALDWSEHEIR